MSAAPTATTRPLGKQTGKAHSSRPLPMSATSATTLKTTTVSPTMSTTSTDTPTSTSWWRWRGTQKAASPIKHRQKPKREDKSHERSNEDEEQQSQKDEFFQELQHLPPEEQFRRKQLAVAWLTKRRRLMQKQQEQQQEEEGQKQPSSSAQTPHCPVDVDSGEAWDPVEISGDAEAEGSWDKDGPASAVSGYNDNSNNRMRNSNYPLSLDDAWTVSSKSAMSDRTPVIHNLYGGVVPTSIRRPPLQPTGVYAGDRYNDENYNIDEEGFDVCEDENKKSDDGDADYDEELAASANNRRQREKKYSSGQGVMSSHPRFACVQPFQAAMERMKGKMMGAMEQPHVAPSPTSTSVTNETLSADSSNSTPDWCNPQQYTTQQVSIALLVCVILLIIMIVIIVKVSLSSDPPPDSLSTLSLYPSFSPTTVDLAMSTIAPTSNRSA